jgi:hypothetical protein
MMDLSGGWQQQLIHCFENSPYMLFPVALSDYGQYYTQDSNIVRFNVSGAERVFLTWPESFT